MRDKVIRDFERRLSPAVMVSGRQVIAENVYPGYVEIFQWLHALVKDHLLYEKIPLSFDEQIKNNEGLRELIRQGDQFYHTLFKKEGFIDAHTQDLEKEQPLSYVIQRIFANRFFGDRMHDSSLVIYDELKTSIARGMGNHLGVDPDLQYFKIWMQICDYLETEHDVYNGWRKSIPVSSIEAELSKLCIVPDEIPLTERAYMGGYGKDNEAIADHYIKQLSEAVGKPDWEYVEDAISGMDMLHLKQHIFFRQSVLKKIGISKWLLLCDSLGYPALQDHIFLDIETVDDFPAIVDAICDSTQALKTKRQHLLLIALENYYEFVKRTLSDLNDLVSGGRSYDHPDREKIIAGAKIAYDNWVDKIVPETVTKIFDSIFREDELKKSNFFIPVFDWSNSHGKQSLDESRNKGEILLIDTINNQFQNKLNRQEKDRHFLVSTLLPQQYNWPAFEKLISIHAENKTDTVFRDSIFQKHILFLESEKFWWSTKETINFGIVINQAYHFSQVIACYPDAFEKWEKAYQRHRIHNEGWARTAADFRNHYRESYLLTVGIGIAYHLYVEEKKPEADDVLEKVMAIVISQHRNTGDYTSGDYVTPLKFAAIAISRFAKEKVEWFLLMLIEKIDKLSYLLIVVYELTLYANEVSWSAAIRQKIEERVENEFWVIENRKSHHALMHELDYLTKLKTEVLSFLAK